MKKLLFPLFMLAMIVTSCEKDPDMNKLDSDYSVYTDYDNSVQNPNCRSWALVLSPPLKILVNPLL